MLKKMTKGRSISTGKIVLIHRFSNTFVIFTVQHLVNAEMHSGRRFNRIRRKWESRKSVRKHDHGMNMYETVYIYMFFTKLS